MKHIPAELVTREFGEMRSLALLESYLREREETLTNSHELVETKVKAVHVKFLGFGVGFLSFSQVRRRA